MAPGSGLSLIDMDSSGLAVLMRQLLTIWLVLQEQHWLCELIVTIKEKLVALWVPLAVCCLLHLASWSVLLQTRRPAFMAP